MFNLFCKNTYLPRLVLTVKSKKEVLRKETNRVLSTNFKNW